ncbi:hypothetical protein ACS0TY_018967 [Phlomoides rotata]
MYSWGVWKDRCTVLHSRSVQEAHISAGWTDCCLRNYKECRNVMNISGFSAAKHHRFFEQIGASSIRLLLIQLQWQRKKNKSMLRKSLEMMVEFPSLSSYNAALRTISRKNRLYSLQKACCEEADKEGEEGIKGPQTSLRGLQVLSLFLCMKILEYFMKQYKEKHPNNKSVATVGKAGGDWWKSLTSCLLWAFWDYRDFD